MEEQRKSEKSEAAKQPEQGTNGLGPEPASPQPPEPAVKSRSDQVQETIDRNLAEAAARQKLTDEVIAKREQTAATVEAEQPAEAERTAEQSDIDRAAAATTEIVDHVKKDAKARELREIEMHNAQIDSMNAQIATLANIKEVHETMCNILSDIVGTLKEISKSLCDIAGKA